MKQCVSKQNKLQLFVRFSWWFVSLNFHLGLYLLQMLYLCNKIHKVV